METKTELLCEILWGGYLDVDYLCKLLDENSIDFSTINDRCNMSSWVEWLDINHYIYYTLEEIAEHFITNNENDIAAILKMPTDTLNEEDLYEIYVNYIDSSLRFIHDNIQELFEKKGYRI